MSYAKNKGTKFESDIVKYLLECGFTDPRRVVMSGAAGDKGDLHLGPIYNPAFIIECKNYKNEYPYKMIEDFVSEAHTEYLNSHKNEKVNNYRALLIAKRPNLGIADSWLIWKNEYNTTIRCRLGDLINKENFLNCINDNDRFIKLEAMLKNKKEG